MKSTQQPEALERKLDIIRRYNRRTVQLIEHLKRTNPKAYNIAGQGYDLTTKSHERCGDGIVGELMRTGIKPALADVQMASGLAYQARAIVLASPAQAAESDSTEIKLTTGPRSFSGLLEDRGWRAFFRVVLWDCHKQLREALEDA